ncbi:hypothetical protein [Anoxynatronum buryatiense]|uniref:Uncharacterized protein n=1 Tax=Anoxynatronum buryatiense TaxID=489973 RepID=A0AA45WUA6_9CLOT|nr:hypothetical protein [Anoxynatronum buryatiense]SMP43064.1 hypothetical protein SAMN06296020_10229 [Anoxynatronum buryatiense]
MGGKGANLGEMMGRALFFLLLFLMSPRAIPQEAVLKARLTKAEKQPFQ